jgi:hypothetical protein
MINMWSGHRPPSLSSSLNDSTTFSGVAISAWAQTDVKNKRVIFSNIYTIWVSSPDKASDSDAVSNEEQYSSLKLLRYFILFISFSKSLIIL